MKVLVLGAGVVGTACAHYLSRDGHDVTVIDRQPAAGLETSFGNAGGVCPGFAGPWAAPSMPLKVMRWLFLSNAPLMLRPRLDPHQWRWLASFVGNCTAERFAKNKARMQRIAHYSKSCLVELRRQTRIEYDEGTNGVLQIFRTDEEFEGGRRAAKVLEQFEVPHRIVSASEVRTIEPALNVSQVRLTGGLHLPDDETGDCHLFTQRLAARLETKGVTFLYETAVQSIVADNSQIKGIMTDRGAMRADCYIVALANNAPVLLRPLGINLPIYPVKGYAITLSNAEGGAMPRSSVMDEHSKVMITRLGNRLRAAGVAEIAGYSRETNPAKTRGVVEAARELFPNAGDYSKVSYWAGLRPMTPDGPPYLGATKYANLLLNVGQGSNGWTQACGCGRILADLVAGRNPQIDLEGLTVARLE